MVKSAKPQPTPLARPAAEIKIQNGVPALLLNGKPVAPLVVDLEPDTPMEDLSRIVAAGVQGFRLQDVDLGWIGAGQYDYEALDARLSRLMSGAPEAFFIVQICVDAPTWWRAAHPGECARFLQNNEKHTEVVASWASRRWRTEAGNALARLVRHIHQGEWGVRCAGWQITAGVAGEWRHPHAEDMPDVSGCMTDHFRQWVSLKYRKNTGLLRKAWFDTRAEFAAITCPGLAERKRADFGVLRNPQRSRRVLDYYESLFDAQNTAALHFCAAVKRACEGQAPVGLAYATVSENGAWPEDGHGFPEPVLDAAEVQFFANRGASNGSHARSLTGSLALRGKFLFHEAPQAGDAKQAAALALTRQAGLIVPANTSQEALRSIRLAMERALPLSSKVRYGRSPFAVLCDMANAQYIADPADPSVALNPLLFTTQIQELARTGAPFDLYLLSDLFHPKFPDHPIFLFLNTFYLSEAERRRVDARVKRSGQTAVWLWGAGLIGEEGVSAEYSYRLCGQKARMEATSISLRVRIAEANDPLTWGQHMGSHFGPERPVSPTITIGDKAVTRLGANTANKTVFAVHRFENWTSIVYGTPLVPASLLRNLLRATGSHVYVDVSVDADLFADSRSVGVYTARGGDIPISLPGRFDVLDAWSNRPIARNVSEFTANIAPRSTRYFELRKAAGEEPSASGRKT